MGAPERTAEMESDKMNELPEGEEPVATVEVDSPRDQLAWAQHWHDSQFFDFTSFSPRGLISPRTESGGFPDLGALCTSPLFSDHIKFLQSWSPRVSNAESGASGAPSAVTPSPTITDQLKFIQSLDLARVSNAECVSTSVSCDSDSDVKVATSESIGSGDEAGKSRKRKSVEPDEEHVDDTSEGDEMDDKDRRVHKSLKQQKMKGPKRSREPRYAIKTRTEVDIMEDGYKWRKYGQKPVKNSPHPRNYYRCTTANCPVRKRVERSLEDPGLVVTSYEGTHTHPKVNQPKRTASGNFPQFEAAESLSESLNHLNRQQAATNSAPPSNLGLPNLPNLGHLFPGFPGWPSLMNRQGPPAGALPSLQDNTGLMMAYQIVRLQWELQAKAQQFMSYNAAQGGYPGGLPKMNPFMDPLGFLQAQSQLPLPDMGLMSFGESSDSDVELERIQFPKVPEAFSSANSLLSRRAQRTGSPLNPNLQSAMMMRQLVSQAMAGLHQSALDQQEGLGEGGDRPGAS